MVVGGSGGNVVVGGSGGNHGVCLEEERRQPTNRWQPQDSSYIININNTIMYILYGSAAAATWSLFAWFQ